MNDVATIWQFDMQADDIAASKKLVADWKLEYYPNGNPLRDWFYSMQNAPDGKIYLFPPNGRNMMHVIHRPDLPAPDCKFEQHAIFFKYFYDNRPNFPNYRLGALDGSPCDTLGFDNLPLADFRPDPSDTSGLAFTFFDLASYQPTHWLWDFGDGKWSKAKSPNHVFAAPGFYNVCQTVSNAYGKSSKCRVIEVHTTSTNDPLQTNTLVLYPNPTTGIVHFATADIFSEKIVEVLDISGKLLISKNLTIN